MSYRERMKWKNIVKRWMYKLEVFIEEKSIHLSNGAKIVMFGVLVCIVSLFMDWIQSQ